MPPLKLIWTDGHFKKKVPDVLEEGRTMPASGAVIYGEKETILHGSHGAGGMRIIPESRMKAFQRPDKTIPRVKGGHEGDWLRACKDGKPASSNFSYGGPLTEMALLGVIAMRVPGRKLLWDSTNLKFTNSPEANAFVHPEYRKGWTL